MEFYVRLIFAVKKIRVSHSAQKIEKNMQQQLTKGCLPKSDFQKLVHNVTTFHFFIICQHNVHQHILICISTLSLPTCP